MDGVSEEDNEIFLELSPDNLMKALRTANSAKSVKIKLTKKAAPALTFDVEQVRKCVTTRTLLLIGILRTCGLISRACNITILSDLILYSQF